MHSRDTIFRAQVLAPHEFDEHVDSFSRDTNWHYATQYWNGYDSFPQYPLYIEYVCGNRLVFIMGLIAGRSPGVHILKGVVKASGFEDDIHSAWEVLKRTPGEMSELECDETLKSLRRRLRYAATKLAEMAGLKRCETDETILCQLTSLTQPSEPPV
jgi:hypothetical protein